MSRIMSSRMQTFQDMHLIVKNLLEVLVTWKSYMFKLPGKADLNIVYIWKDSTKKKFTTVNKSYK